MTEVKKLLTQEYPSRYAHVGPRATDEQASRRVVLTGRCATLICLLMYFFEKE